MIQLEIKLHSAPAKALVKGLFSCMQDLDTARGFVIYPGRESYSLGASVEVVPAHEVLTMPERIVA